jgi:hypothetical protein
MTGFCKLWGRRDDLLVCGFVEVFPVYFLFIGLATESVRQAKILAEFIGKELQIWYPAQRISTVLPRHSKELRASELSWLLGYNDHRLTMASQSGPQLSAPAEIIPHHHDNNLTACAAENSIGRNFFSVCETEQALFDTGYLRNRYAHQTQ